MNHDILDGKIIDGYYYLKKGEAIAFPPYWTHPHEVSAPENGTFRYTINTWLYE